MKHLTLETVLHLVAAMEDDDEPLDASEFLSIDVEAARELARHRAGWLALDGLSALAEDAAKELASFPGPLYLNGLRELSTDVARALAAHAGGKLSLDGLTRLSDEAAQALAGYAGMLGLDGLESLSPAAYQVLRSRSEGISMEGLDTLPEWEFDGEQWDYQGDEARCLPHYVDLIELSLSSLKGSSPELLKALHVFLDEMIVLASQGVPIFMERHEKVQVVTVAAQCRSSQVDPVSVLLHTLLLLAESRPLCTRRDPDRRDALFALSVEYPELASALAAQVCAMPEGVLEQALEAWSQEPPDSRRKIHLTRVQNWLPRLRQDFPAALSSPAPASESFSQPCL